MNWPSLFRRCGLTITFFAIVVHNVAGQSVAGQSVAGQSVWGHDLDAKTKLIAAMDQYATHWEQGFIEAQVESVAGPADVTMWWDGDTWRLDYVTYRTSGEGVEPTWNIFVVSQDEYCRYSPLTDSLSEGSKDSLPDVQRRVQLRVRPTQSWFELSRERPFKKWLTSQHRDEQSEVIQRPDGGFLAFIGRSEHVRKYAQAASQGAISDEALDQGFVVRAEFNANGLLTRARYLGEPPGGSSIDLHYEWTDDPIPMPKRLLRRFRSNRNQGFYTHLKIDVIRVDNRLPPDAPSFQVPPNDLPLHKTEGE